jgi:hypothetical protein
MENKIHWAEQFRTVAAMGGDVGYVTVTSLVTSANSGTANKVQRIQFSWQRHGVCTLAVRHLQSTLSLWYLHSASELQQDGDTVPASTLQEGMSPQLWNNGKSHITA